MLILKGHLSTKPVRSLAFSPDGSRLASSARDYKTFLWDLSTCEHQVIQDRDAYNVAFSPDGTEVVTGRGQSLTVWNCDTGALRTVSLSHDFGRAGVDVAYSPDGQLLATARGSVRLWNSQTLESLPFRSGEYQRANATNSLAFTRDGKTLATGHDERLGGQLNRIVRLWDVGVKRECGILRGHTAPVGALSFSPDGRSLAATAGTSLWIWDVSSRKPLVHHKINDQHYKDVVFSPDGRFLLFARNDATVQVWNTSGWSEAAAYDFTIGPMISLAVAPDSMRAAGGSGRGKIVVFDIDH